MLNSSNPALSEAALAQPAFAATSSDVVTVQAVVNRTAMLLLLAIAAGGGGYMLAERVPGLMQITWIAALVVSLGVGFAIYMRPTMAVWLAPIYAAVEGVFLGGLTAFADHILEAKGLAVAGGVGIQAFVVTVCAMLSMLALYSAGLVRPTARFKAVVTTLTGAICVTYLVSIVLSFIWKPLPLVSFASAARDTGWTGLLGLGINLFILVVASLFLVIDFERVEKLVAQRAPKSMAWYGAFSLLVTLAWIYYESVKLVLRVAVLFGGRD